MLSVKNLIKVYQLKNDNTKVVAFLTNLIPVSKISRKKPIDATGNR